MSSNVESLIEAAEQEWLEHWTRGASRLRWSRIPLQVGDSAPDFVLPDMSGQPVHLRDTWKDRPALLLFWRHYGCGCGIERAQRLVQEYPEYTQAGANVVIIGAGEPERSALYVQTHSLPCPMLSDPAYQVYQAYDLLEGKPSQIIFSGSEELLRCDYDAGVQLAQSRHGTVRAVVDNPWQLPGEFVVDQRGVIRLAYRYQYCTDFPNPLVLLAAIKEAIRETEAA
jgi:peroxiredoxin